MQKNSINNISIFLFQKNIVTLAIENEKKI